LHWVSKNEIKEFLSFVWIRNIRKKTIADICCWTWPITQALLKNIEMPSKIYCIDSDTDQLIILDRKVWQKNWTKLLLIKNSITNLFSIPNNILDVAFIKMWLHEVQKQDQLSALVELHRVLWPKWVIAIRNTVLDEWLQNVIQKIIRKKDELSWLDQNVNNRYLFSQSELLFNLEKVWFSDITKKNHINNTFSTKWRLLKELVSYENLELLNEFIIDVTDKKQRLQMNMKVLWNDIQFDIPQLWISAKKG
jgi:ubiquinone/menaquinone biosynthesis C-methylase UbiE